MGDRLEQLAANARLIEGRPIRCERLAGHHTWDPEVVIAVFRAEAERVARIAGGLTGDERLPVACRRGLGLIAAELVNHLVRDGEAYFQQAQLAMAASEPTIGTALVLTTLVLIVFGLEAWQVWRLHR